MSSAQWAEDKILVKVKEVKEEAKAQEVEETTDKAKVEATAGLCLSLFRLAISRIITHVQHRRP